MNNNLPVIQMNPGETILGYASFKPNKLLTEIDLLLKQNKLLEKRIKKLERKIAKYETLNDLNDEYLKKITERKSSVKPKRNTRREV